MTHVQTEVPEEEYERLRALAGERGLSIREALREATELWIEERDAVNPDDPLFDSVESVRDGSPNHDREPTSVTTEDALVEEWTGDAEESRLAEPE
jgi:predicted DNA-binding protein